MVGVNSLCKLSWNTRYLSIIVVQRGYRKGLVDATSGFCLKTPLRKTMATEDVCYVLAQNVYEFIWEKMEGDERNFYECREFSSELSKEQLTIPGSRKCEDILFFIRWNSNQDGIRIQSNLFLWVLLW